MSQRPPIPIKVIPQLNTEPPYAYGDPNVYIHNGMALVATADLPPPGEAMDGRVMLEYAAGPTLNLVAYINGALWRSPFSEVFFSNAGGSGYGVGPFGTVPWDITVAPAGAYTVLSQGVKIPNIATVGWGKEINDTFFTPLNDLLDRLTALGV